MHELTDVQDVLIQYHEGSALVVYPMSEFFFCEILQVQVHLEVHFCPVPQTVNDLTPNQKREEKYVGGSN